MTAEEYYIGLKYKSKKGKISDGLLISTAVMIAVMTLLSIEFEMGKIYTAVFAFIPIIMYFLEKNIKKQAAIKNYNVMPQLNSQQTIHLCDDGIKLFNGFEKVYAPWKKIFAVKETPKYLIIIFTFRKGLAVVNKEKWQSEELDEIIDALHKNIEVEEGKR